tara:strand:- start:747 stop:968 length:222 start_codon:yes stop_codon:yes gene_type:complete
VKKGSYYFLHFTCVNIEKETFKMLNFLKEIWKRVIKMFRPQKSCLYCGCIEEQVCCGRVKNCGCDCGCHQEQV